MSGAWNNDFIRFEKTLNPDVAALSIKGLSVYSLLRLHIFSCFRAASIPTHSGVERKRPSVTLAATVLRLKTSVTELLTLCKFVASIARHRRLDAIIRVNSFSIGRAASPGGQLKNKNLQAIHDRIQSMGGNVLVIVTDLTDYRLSAKLNGAILYPSRSVKLLQRLFRCPVKASISRTVGACLSGFPLTKDDLLNILAEQLITMRVWRGVLSFLKPTTIYYESPHYSFEPEIVAAKMRGIKTIEIYHGTINFSEAAYYLKHLSLGEGVNGICFEYLSPTSRQSRYLQSINSEYKLVSTIEYISSMVLTQREKFRLRTARRKRCNRYRRMLLVSTIADGDIEDIRRYVGKNRKKLLSTFKEVSIRLHPDDDIGRWASLLERFRFLKVSHNSLIEDLIRSDRFVTTNSTVVLQLKKLGLEYCNLQEELI